MPLSVRRAICMLWCQTVHILTKARECIFDALKFLEISETAFAHSDQAREPYVKSFYL